MIAGDLQHIEQQVSMTPRLERAFRFLTVTDCSSLPDGTVEIEGRDVFAVVQRYETIEKGAPKFEYHRSYIDIQVVLSGEEIIGWAPAELIAVTEAYDGEKDICFGTVPEDAWTPLLLKAGGAAILYPEDGHAPRLAPGQPGPVLKVVVKVAV